MRRLSKTWQTPTRRQTVILILLLAVSAFSGCARLTPKTAALKQIHDSYRTEFLKLIQAPTPLPTAPTDKPLNDEPVFVDTLRQIREYRVKYGQNPKSQEAAHVTVLEGMIYLQTRQFGLARLIQSDVTAAADNLKSATGEDARDRLLAQNYTALVDGWQQIFNETAPGGMSVQTLGEDAEKIRSNLDSDKRPKSELEADDGALYLATTVAIFYAHLHDHCKKQGANPTGPCKPPESSHIQAYTPGLGADLIGKFLTDKEKSVADNPNSNDPQLGGRFRFISWYRFLKNPPQ